ncbi:MAG: family 20 glycosylhydrolase [Chitinophagaceae bacterium]|nr:family 20 glycosylhydrolase [Chitinophagaceae bacterium]
MVINLAAQPVRDEANTLFNTYYYQRSSQFQMLPKTGQEIFFIGDSITEGGEWSELFDDIRIKNRGISGDISAGVLYRINQIALHKPDKVFLMIGVNDLARGITPDSLVKNIHLIVQVINKQSPATQIFVESILPVNGDFKKFNGHSNRVSEIKEANALLSRKSDKTRFSFINLYDRFCAQSDKLNPEYTNDGLHLNGKGYLLWKSVLYPYVYDVSLKPAIIPTPDKLEWGNEYFPLYQSHNIVVQDSAVIGEAISLQQSMQQLGIKTSLVTTIDTISPYIQISLVKSVVPSQPTGAYQLTVSSKKILITAVDNNGIFYAIQTLKQLMQDGVYVNTCTIKDHPAFPVRGFMIDVGRNYISIPLLKEMINRMALYKLNVFHFHATEDIAWRFESKLYPALTAPDNMLRDKGMYYTVEEIKELIDYCRVRHIQFVPEIDMPGHSAAFKRAFKTDMQTDSGLAIVKKILTEFCDTYIDLPYIHIGADEVKITNPKFVPEVIALLESSGKKVIGWEPGGNFSSSVIRQLWMDDLKRITADTQIAYIDSRHLYLNHMDPLESVVTIYNRRIAGKKAGDDKALGGILCVWNDRRQAAETDVLRMNPVYPGMVSFAERSWVGGGQEGWVANISDGDENGFRLFEQKLLDHQTLYFKKQPFPYAQQTQMQWSIYGPYYNQGKLNQQFAIEKTIWQDSSSLAEPKQSVIGGTVVLRHWWAPLIKGALKNPQENQTYYATTKIWSDVDQLQNFWIGFNNLSRSTATDSPPKNAWDARSSKVWLNGKEIVAPDWKRGGQIGHSEIPLIDEGYEYRSPYPLQLKKGWNTVLLKLPMGSFKGRDWQNVQKWMFTFLPLQNGR